MDAYTIVGVGGIGCALAYALAAAGSSVQCVEDAPQKLQWGRLHGLRVNQLRPLPVELVAFDQWEPRRQSTIILSTRFFPIARPERV
jgi:ketopantoate reductase